MRCKCDFMQNSNPKNNLKEVKQKKITKKAIISIALICFAFGGSFLIYFVLQISLGTEIPIVVVISPSMEPTIKKGDMLFVKGTEPYLIKNGTIEGKEGDIIVFDAQGLWPDTPDEPIVHRVIDKYLVGDVWYFLTKGDNNHVPDAAPVSEDRIYGIIIGIIPFIGWVKIILTESGLLIPLLVIISILLIVSIIRDTIKEKDIDEQSKQEKKRDLEN